MGSPTPADTRSWLAGELGAALAGFADVLAFPRWGDQPTRWRVMLAPDTVTPADVACPSRTVGLVVWCLTPYTEPDRAYDDADSLVTAVLDALDDLAVPWEPAQLVVVNDTTTAYRVAVEIPQE